MLNAFAALATALVLPTVALAQSGGQPAVDAASPPIVNATTTPAVESGSAAGREGNRRVCRTSGVTGSRIAAAKVCKTAREWEEQRAAARAEMEKRQRVDGPPGS